MTRFYSSIWNGVVSRMLLVLIAAVVVGLGHQFLTEGDLVISLQFAGAAAWGAVIMDIGKDIVLHLSRR